MLNIESYQKYSQYSLAYFLEYLKYRLQKVLFLLSNMLHKEDCELLEIVNQIQLKYYNFQKIFTVISPPSKVIL